MSNIHYRVWQVSKKKYLDDSEILLAPNGELVMRDGLVKQDPMDFIFELQSNYKDSSGRIIYEGDVLRWADDGYSNSLHDYAAVVVFDGRYFKLHSETDGWFSLEFLPVGLVVVGTMNQIFALCSKVEL